MMCAFFHVRSPLRAAMVLHATESGRNNPALTLSVKTGNATMTPFSSRKCSNNKPGHNVDPGIKVTRVPSAHTPPGMSWYTVTRIWPTPEISMRCELLFLSRENDKVSATSKLKQAPVNGQSIFLSH